MRNRGTEIEGLKGRWVRIDLDCVDQQFEYEISYGHEKRDNFLKLFPRIGPHEKPWQDVVLFRRLPDPQPMPELQAGDGLIWFVLEATHTGIYIGECRAADICGNVSVLDTMQIQNIFRDGDCIWEREDNSTQAVLNR